MHDPLVVAFEIKRPWRKHMHGGFSYRPALVTVWHREPRGHDSGTVCKIFRSGRKTNAWKLHAHHWRIQVPPLQSLRRWALTRCAWCGGSSRKGDYVNHSQSWDGPRGHWWQGAPGVFHEDCISVQRAHRLCFCADPLLSHAGYGQCATCGEFRSWREEPDDADRILRALPAGSRIPDSIRPQLTAAWDERRARRAAAS